MASLAPENMYRVLEEHMTAELNGDAAHAVTVYTDDVTHEVVGWPGGPVHGPDAARAFYEEFMAQFKAEHVTLLAERSGADFLVVEHEITGSVTGVMMGVAGHGRRITVRTLHVIAFRGEKICSEQVWIDSGAVVAQLTA